MPETFQNYIRGEWQPAARREVYENHNPADRRDVIGFFAASTPEDVASACEAAAEALPAWRALAAPERGQYLAKAADVLQSRLEEVAQALTREEGKTLAEARGETARAVAILRYYAGEGLRPVGEVIPSFGARSFLFTTRVPLGVCVLITPWNFPIAVPAWKIAPALVYGNTVVFKPASLTPHTAVLLAQVFDEAGIPEGVFNLVTGSGALIGESLVCHPEVRGVSFTGSNSVGKRIAALAVERGVRYQLEMGGKNPILIAPDADLEQAVELTVRGAMLSCGQKCTATSRAIVCAPLVEAFTERVIRRVASLKQGPGTDESCFLGPVVSEEQRQKILEYIRVGQEEGARLLIGGGVPEGPQFAHGYYVQPTVFGDVSPKMRIAQEEIFGPVLAILPAKDLDEAIAIANDVRFGLSASLVTRNLNAALTYVDRIEAGLVRVNGETAGVEPQAPFGGMKESSSYSREQGRAAIEFFTQVKTVCIERAAP